MRMTPISTLADVEALESLPIESVVPARSTYELIARAAQRFPERDAFRYLPDGNPATPAHRVTYAELIERINQAANLFAAMGVGPDDAVAILAPNIPETHFALWGAQLAGRACPINYLLQPVQIAALLKASNAKLIVALGPNDALNLWPTVEKVRALCSLPTLQIRVGDDASADAPRIPVFQDQIGLQVSKNLLNKLFNSEHVSENIAACFHTGGTTGAPKLALHTHRNEVFTSTLAPRFYGFDENTVEINGFPLFHVAGAFVYGLSVLSVGGTQILPTLSGMRNAAFVKNYWKFCEREKVTALAAVPTVLTTLLNLAVDADIASVKVAYTGGSPLPSELAAQFERKLNIPVRNILGMTESAGLVCIEPFAAPRVPGSVGLRLPFTQVRVVRWQGGAAMLADECAVDETGVVVVRGPHVSPGYSDPQCNAGMFEALPIQNGGGKLAGHWLISGDLGHCDAQGRVYITGRAKDVIIRGSHNIDPGLVEEAFLAHSAVALCAVVGEPDAYAGELPVAFVTLKPGHSMDAAALLAAVTPHVYEPPAVPKRVTILDAMPMTAVGKIFKPELRLKAIEVKLAEMLVGVLPGCAVTVLAEDRPKGQVAVIRVSGGGAKAGQVNAVEMLREKLASIAMVCEFVLD